MNLNINLELADLRPYAQQYPSKYWFLLVIEMMHRGLGQWVEDGDELVAYIPKQAIEMMLDSDWIRDPRKVEVDIKKSKTYLMRDRRNGLIKIGRSYNPGAREKTLQSEAPDIELLATCDIDIEAELHKKYADYRVRGEWFRLNPISVSSIISQYGFTEL